MKKIILVLFSFYGLIGNAQIEKVNPPFWFKNMQLNQLQIMLYGKDIAKYQPKIADVPIVGIQKTENPNYIFVTVNSKDLQKDVYSITLNHKNKVVDSYDFKVLDRRANSEFRVGFNSSDAMYLLMPDRFANGNPENDSVKDLEEKSDRSKKGGRHGGDIQGIINNLDYIKSLGMTSIWSTPLLEDNDKTYSYHTYAQSNVYKIDSRYGSNEDYKRLGSELHKRDMKLIMDYVTNHWGITHWMIKDLPTYDWIHQFPGYANSNYRMSTQYDPNVSKIDKKYCVDGWFVPTMPDLNQSNPLVLKYLIQNAIWWIEYADLDGLRVDTYSYNDKQAIANWTKAIMDEYPNFNIVGEVWLHNQAQIAYWQKDSEIGAIQSYNSHLPSVMDFTLHDAIGTVFKEENPSWNNGMIKVYENMVNDFLYPDINNLLLFAENHDTARINHIYPSLAAYKLSMVLLATSRGIPQLYYGSEIGMAGDKNKGDGDIRRDFPGGWSQDPINAFNEKERTKKQSGYFNFTSKLFQWRKTKEVIHSGKTMQFLPENNVYVYFRYTEKESVMVILNNNPEAVSLDLARFNEQLKGYTKAKEVLTDKVIDLEDTLPLKGKTAMVLELNK